MARYSFSGSTPPEFELKLRCNKQRFGKMATTGVLDKDEKLLWSRLQWHRSCHSNEITPLAERCSYKIVYGSLIFPPIAAPMFVKFKRNHKRVIEIFWDEVLMVRNTVKNGQCWRLAVICRKRSAFGMQFHLIVVWIFLETCVKDRGDRSSRLLERWIWLVCIEALLLAV